MPRHIPIVDHHDRSTIYTHSHNFIGGSWREADAADWLPLVDCYTEEPFGSTPVSSPIDVGLAVSAAEAALPYIASLPAASRADMLDMLSAQVEERADDLAAIWAREAGMPIATGRVAVRALPTATLAILSDYLRGGDETMHLGNTIVVKEPVGVVGAITPWNYPFSQVLIKFATALAAGCSVVVKPSELAPTSASVLAEMIHQLGLPDGAFNLVSGDGVLTGEALVSHPGIAALSFTGSTTTGRRIMELASQRVKRVVLELGGKSPMLVLDEASMIVGVNEAVRSCMRNNGQTCTSLTRLLVPSELVEDAAAIAASIAESFTLGDPLDETTTLGPLVSASQYTRVRDFIQSGIDDGAMLITGGLDRPGTSGYFVYPTVFSNVDPAMRIAQHEIFGPVLSISTFDSVEEAVEIANGTDYGLAASVRSGDPDLAFDIARRLRAGTVTVNGGAFNPAAPYGGAGQSGLGRELGVWGVDEFVEWKAVHLP